MISVKISSGKSVSYDAKEFQERFPESIISVSIDLDPMVQEIVITQPCITLPVLHMLSMILDGSGKWETEAKSISKDTLASAGKYLNIRLLEVLGHPGYDTYRCLSEYHDLLDPRPRDEIYHWILRHAVEQSYGSLFEYMLPLGVPEDRTLIHDLIRKNNFPLMKMLLSSGAYADAFPGMLLDSVTPIKVLSESILELIIARYSSEVGWSDCISIFTKINRLDLAKVILRYPNIEVSQEAFEDCVAYGDMPTFESAIARLDFMMDDPLVFKRLLVEPGWRYDEYYKALHRFASVNLPLSKMKYQVLCQRRLIMGHIRTLYDSLADPETLTMDKVKCLIVEFPASEWKNIYLQCLCVWTRLGRLDYIKALLAMTDLAKDEHVLRTIAGIAKYHDHTDIFRCCIQVDPTGFLGRAINLSW